MENAVLERSVRWIDKRIVLFIVKEILTAVYTVPNAKVGSAIIEEFAIVSNETIEQNKDLCV